MLLVWTFDNLAVIISISININHSHSKCFAGLVQFFCSLSHFLVLINNLSKQILSLHILHFITAHFAFITAQIGYHCTLKLGMGRGANAPSLYVKKGPMWMHTQSNITK